MPQYTSKEEQQHCEMVAGKRAVAKAMAEGLVMQVREKWKIKPLIHVNFSSHDMNEWVIYCVVSEDATIEDRWDAFPSEEFRAKLMLLGMM